MGKLNRKINVLLYVNSLQQGGIENQVVLLANALNKNIFKVILCCHVDRNKAFLNFVNTEFVKLVFLNWRMRSFSVGLRRFIHVLKMERIDIIHTHGFGVGLWGRIAAWMARVPVIIVHEHGKTLWKKPRHHLFERIATNFTDMRIAVSKDILELRIKREKTPNSKICFIPNGVNLASYLGHAKTTIKNLLDIAHVEFVIGTVGRLVPAKAYQVLIDAFAMINAQNHSACLLFIGDGELRDDLQSYSEKRQVSDKIFFLGARDDIPQLLSALDVFVISSDREGLPVAMLEAMASKIPVVATAVGGIPEVINSGQNGVLVPPRDPKKLAGELIAMLKNPASRQSIAEAGYVTVRENYSIETITSQIEEIYLHFAKQKLSIHA